MFTPYRRIFTVPGTAKFSAAGLVARLPISMLGIGTVLLVSEATGRYAVAGAVAATIAISAGVVGPLAARLIDRFGQARVLRPTLALFLVGLVSLLVAVDTGAPTWTWFLAAVLCGALPQFGALVRARWAAVLEAGPPRQTAYALEAVVDEVVFVAGPPLVTLLAVGISPTVGLVVAGGFAAIGGIALAVQRHTEPAPAERDRPHPKLRTVLGPGLIVVALAMVGTGAVFGSVEIIVVAFTEAEGRPGWAGIILALWAFGSLIAGLLYGAVSWRRAAAVRFLISAVVFAGATLLLLVVDSLLTLAAVMLLSGLAISPILIGSVAVVETVMPPGTLTEGLAWQTTGLVLGVTIGAAVAGPLIDTFGPERSFLLPIAAASFGLVSVLAGSRWLVGRRSVMLAG